MDNGNHISIHDRFHPFSPNYIGKETMETKECSVCERHIEEHLTATVKEANWTVCVGCVKMLDLREQFRDSNDDDFASVMNQLKPIL